MAADPYEDYDPEVPTRPVFFNGCGHTVQMAGPGDTDLSDNDFGPGTDSDQTLVSNGPCPHADHVKPKRRRTYKLPRERDWPHEGQAA